MIPMCWHSAVKSCSDATEKNTNHRSQVFCPCYCPYHTEKLQQRSSDSSSWWLQVVWLFLLYLRGKGIFSTEDGAVNIQETQTQNRHNCCFYFSKVLSFKTPKRFWIFNQENKKSWFSWDQFFILCSLCFCTILLAVLVVYIHMYKSSCCEAQSVTQNNFIWTWS